MRFVESMSAGGGSGIFDALKRVFRFPKLEAIYLVTDGKNAVGEEVLNRIRTLYLSHPSRPKLNIISINCVPEHLTYRALQTAANLTQAIFRPVVLEQEVIDPVELQESISGSTGLNLMPVKPMATTDE